MEHIAEVWKRYCAKLYIAEKSQEPSQQIYGTEKPEKRILFEEVVRVIEYLKRHKTPGPDTISDKVYKSGEAIFDLQHLQRAMENRVVRNSASKLI